MTRMGTPATHKAIPLNMIASEQLFVEVLLLPKRTEDESQGSCQRQRGQRLILERLIDGVFQIACNLLHFVASFAALLSYAASDLIGLVGHIPEFVGRFVGDVLECVGCFLFEVLTRTSGLGAIRGGLRGHRETPC